MLRAGVAPNGASATDAAWGRRDVVVDLDMTE